MAADSARRNRNDKATGIDIILIIVLKLASGMMPCTTNTTLLSNQVIYDREKVKFFGPHRGPCSDPDATRDGAAQGAPGRCGLAGSRDASAVRRTSGP